jgi:hypothetical protein
LTMRICFAVERPCRKHLALALPLFHAFFPRKLNVFLLESYPRLTARIQIINGSQRPRVTMKHFRTTMPELSTF